jgi:hypothetical protein
LTKDLVIFSNLGKNCLHRAKISIFPRFSPGWSQVGGKKK